MSLTIENTSTWEYQRFDWPAVMACLRKYAARFPEDATEESIIKDVMHGRLVLWLVLDEQGKPVGAVLVSVTTVDATGWKRATVNGYGGNRGIEALPLIAEIEKWAIEQGADEIEAVGRLGWRRLLTRLGYHEAAVILRKRLKWARR